MAVQGRGPLRREGYFAGKKIRTVIVTKLQWTTRKGSSRMLDQIIVGACVRCHACATDTFMNSHSRGAAPQSAELSSVFAWKSKFLVFSSPQWWYEDMVIAQAPIGLRSMSRWLFRPPKFECSISKIVLIGTGTWSCTVLCCAARDACPFSFPSVSADHSFHPP